MKIIKIRQPHPRRQKDHKQNITIKMMTCRKKCNLQLHFFSFFRSICLSVCSLFVYLAIFFLVQFSSVFVQQNYTSNIITNDLNSRTRTITFDPVSIFLAINLSLFVNWFDSIDSLSLLIEKRIFFFLWKLMCMFSSSCTLLQSTNKLYSDKYLRLSF